MNKNLQTAEMLFNKAKILETILRDHIATMIVIAKYIQSFDDTSYESAIITRLKHHKDDLDKIVNKKEFIHDAPTSMARLTTLVRFLCKQCKNTIVQANKAFKESKEVQNSITAMKRVIASETKTQTITTSITNMSKLATAFSIAPSIDEWKDITQIAVNTLKECYDTCDYIQEHCIDSDDEDYATMYQIMWTPSELLKEGDHNAKTDTPSQPDATNQT